MSAIVDLPGSALAVLAAKATLLMCLAAGAVLLGRRLSAAARHWTLTLAVCGLLALPFAGGVLPSWTVVKVSGVWAAAESWAREPIAQAVPTGIARDRPAETVAAGEASATAVASPDAPAPSSASWQWSVWTIAGFVYASVALLLVLRLVRQFAAACRLARRADELRDPTWRLVLDEGRSLLGLRRTVRLLDGGPDAMPMAMGVWQPAIVLPSVAGEWPAEKQRAVLLHELSHVARHDCLTQMLAGLAAAAYWPHPGVWWLLRRLRVERELACDDLVLAAGTPARDYAGHLLDVAYTLGRSRAGVLAVGMARRSQLEGRMLAVLDAARNRATPGPKTRWAMAAIATLVLAPLAAATVTSEPLLTVNVDADSVPFNRQTPESVAEHASHEPDRRHTQQLKPAPWAGLVEAVREQAAALAPRGSGSWSLAPSKTPGEVYFEMREGQSRSGTTVKVASLEGLTDAQLTGAGGPVKFALRRDAGTFAFEGTVRDGHGGGTFSFTPSQTFPAELEKRGVGRPTSAEQYELARHDVGLALVDELARRGYTKPTVADLVKAGQHGVRGDYVRELAELGYSLGTLDALITLRDHGVTPNYVRGLASHGFTKIPADELRRVRDHGVTPEFIGELKALGFGSLPLSEFVKVRDHGVTPQYVSEMRSLGYASLPIEALVNARDHGVTPDFVKGLAAHGYTKLSLEEVVRTRDHGVTIDYVREMHALGHKAALVDLVRARDHGVTPGDAREMKALGYDTLTLDELITLRDHGVTPDKARRANERAGTKLPADMLRSLANNGWR